MEQSGARYKDGWDIAVTAVLNIEGAEEEGGSLFNTAGKLVSAHRAHGIHPIYGVYPISGVEKRRKRGGEFPPLKWDKIPFQGWKNGGRLAESFHH